MTDSAAAVAVVGCGEVGLAYAQGIVTVIGMERIRLADPNPTAAASEWARTVGAGLHAEPGGWLRACELVLLCVPGGALRAVLDSVCPLLNTGTVVVDMSTASAEAKQSADDFCGSRGVRYVDIAITGSVALTGSRTPLLYAGPVVDPLVELLRRLGAPLTVLEGSVAGDAIRVKLLRSVIMKGLEALAVECLPAADEYGLLEQVRLCLADVDRTGFVPLLEAMVRTHPRHAARRSAEIAEAASQLEAAGLPSDMTRAAERKFRRTQEITSQGSWPAGESTMETIGWLRGGKVPVG